MTCGFVGWIVMISAGGGGGGGAPAGGGGGGGASAGTGSTATVSSEDDLRLPSPLAFARSRWTASMVSFCWSRNASPSCCSQSSLSFIIVSTWGNETSDFTLSSQSCFFSSSLIVG